MLNVGSNVFGDWVVEEEIGSGAFGTVYKIKRNDFGEVYYAALKEINIPQNQNEHVNLRAEGMDDESISTYYGQLAHDFIKEIKVLSALDGITNIVDYKDHVIIPREPFGYTIYIKMQLLTPLSKKLVDANNKALFMAERDIVDLGIDICSALVVCERHNIIHRDIKIDNIFVSANGDYKLGDFGIAKQLEATQGEMSKKGTLLYMAPEVFRGENYDNTVDIYSLGVVLYRLLNKNRAPFFPDYPNPIKFSDKETANNKRLSGEQLPGIKGVSDDLISVLRKACAFNPAERFRSASDFKKGLEEYKNSVLLKSEQKITTVSADFSLPSEPIMLEEDTEKTGSAFSGVPVAEIAAPVVELQPELSDDTEKTESAFTGVSESEATPVAYSGFEPADDDSEKTESAFAGNNIVEVALHTAKNSNDSSHNPLLETINSAIIFEDSYKGTRDNVEALIKTDGFNEDATETKNLKENSLTDTIKSAVNYEETFDNADKNTYSEQTDKPNKSKKIKIVKIILLSFLCAVVIFLCLCAPLYRLIGMQQDEAENYLSNRLIKYDVILNNSSAPEGEIIYASIGCNGFCYTVFPFGEVKLSVSTGIDPYTEARYTVQHETLDGTREQRLSNATWDTVVELTECNYDKCINIDPGCGFYEEERNGIVELDDGTRYIIFCEN